MANVNINGLPVRIGLDGSEYVPGAPVGETAQRFTTAQIGDLAFQRTFPAAIEFLIDGGGGNIAAQTWGYLTVPFNGNLTGWSLLGDNTGSIRVDVWYATYSAFSPPTVPSSANSITGSNTPALVSAGKNAGGVTGWSSTTLSRGDILAFNVPLASSNITRVTLNLALTRVVS